MNRSTAATLAAIILLGLTLRVLQLDFQPLWWDEGYSVFFATRDFGALLARTAVDIHPPLYYALMQGWTRALGKDALVLRGLSVIIGVAAIPLLYLVAKRLFDRRTARVAAFLLAISPLHVFYSQELRMYGMVTLLALASVALQLKILTAELEIRDSKLEIGNSNLQPPTSNLQPPVLLYILCTTALLYTQYLAAFIIAAQVVVILFLHFRQSPLNLRQWVTRWLAVGVLYLPWVLYAGPKLYAYVTAKVGIEQYSRLDPLTYLAQHLAAFSVGHISEWTWLAWGALVFVGLAIFGFVASLQSQDAIRDTRYAIGYPLSAIRYRLSAIGSPLTAIYLFVPLLLGFLVNLVYPFHPLRYERLLLFAAPFFLILVA
ncbi:MAG: glycosyltransferase family 39 protein, partial [Chloroflexi bacterium]|nr:glycosyltransferase family 39 protein [Chloroflexota bacterium]